MLEKGLKGSYSVVVSDTNTAKTMKSGDLEVFATPSLVAIMEAASVEAIRNEIDEGYTTVGIRIEINHTAPSVTGNTVTAAAEVIDVDSRQITFKVSERDENGVVGEGKHIRCIVNKERFMSKALRSDK